MRKTIFLIAILVISAIIFYKVIAQKLPIRRGSNEWDGSGALKQLASHEATWQKNDEDGNGIKDYYTYDVAGLRYHVNLDGTKLQYIDKRFADADPSVANWDSTVKPFPYLGYYFIALKKDGDGNNYNQNLAARSTGPIIAGETKIGNSTKYGFCAYPAEYDKTGIFTLIANQTGIRYYKDLGGKPIEQWPVKEGEDPAIAGWRIVE